MKKRNQRKMMMFKELLDKIELPPIHKANGREHFLDPFRERLIVKTPEEVVRQKVLQLLLTKLQVPKDMIQVEMLLAKYGIENNRRADIIIEKVNEAEKSISPLAIIECKAPEVMIGDSAIEQALDYADAIGADYVIITNGNSLIVARYDLALDQYIDLNEIPTYKEMLNGLGVPKVLSEPKKRFTYDELEENKFYYRGYEFNPNTPEKFLFFMTNLWEAFLDTSHKLPVGKYKIFELIEDYGIRYLSCGNASGGTYQGEYRSFLIKYKGNTKFLNLAFFDYGTSTILTVSVDQEKNKPHNSLQYSIDKNLYMNGKEFKFIHNGKISVGKKGSGKVADFKAFLSDNCNFLMKGNDIYLGTVHNDRLLYIDDEEVKELIENLLSYALIRDEYREKAKK